MSNAKRPPKGVWGEAGLPLARQYPPLPRRRGLGLALAGAAGVGLVLLGLALVGYRRPLSPGPLSSAHASLESSCGSCHGPGLGGVESASCLECHERAGVAHGAFDFARHTAQSGGGGGVEGEVAAHDAVALECAACHREHGGRRAGLVAVADSLCASCHGFSSFERGHPEFAFRRLELPDDTHLNFAHRHHVARVLAERLPPEAAATNPQLACFTCHNPDPDGTGFAPLEFERHCGACHLTGAESTPALPLADPARPLVPGLLALEDIQARGGAGVRWAYFTDPAEQSVRGGRISKGPLNHADPWVLDNLRRIRATLYPREGLGALLDTRPAGNLDAAGARELTGRALERLRERALELRGGSDPRELARIEELIRVAEGRLAAGEQIAPESFIDPGPPNPALAAAAADGWRELARELATPCLSCHVMVDGALLAVDARQRTLGAARFHHRAHYPERPDCTVCHGAIADLFGHQRLADGTFPPDPADTAATHNLPGIAVCGTCHGEGGSASRCVDCHGFHPDTRFRPELLVAVAASGEGG